MDTRAQKALEHLVREAYAYLSTEIAIFGTGDLGRAVAARITEAGGRVTCTDSNANMWGSTIDGVPVLSPAEAIGRAGAVIIASVAHAALLSSNVRRLCDPDPVVIVSWTDDDVPLVDASRGDAHRAARDLRDRCLALVGPGEPAIVVLPDLAAVTADVRAEWPAVAFMDASQIAARDLRRADASPWIIGDTSPEGCRLAVALSDRGLDVRSPFPAAAHRVIDEWHESMTARRSAAA